MRRTCLFGAITLLGTCQFGGLSCQAGTVPVSTAVKAPANSFPNGDMGAGGAAPEGWSVNWTGSGKLDLSRDTDTYKSPPASLRLRSVGGPATGGAGHPLDVGVKRFTLRGSVRAAGSLKASLVAVQVFDTSWHQTGWINLATVRTGDWQAFSSNVVLPDGAAHARLVVTLDGDGQVWLDDVALTSDSPVAEPAAETDATPLPLAVSPADPRVRVIGRFDTTDPAGPRCAWSASAVQLRFQGTALNVKMGDGSSNAYQVVTDGEPGAVLTTRSGQHLYSVFHGPGGAHTVTLVKRTEAFFGTTQFLGFQLSSGGKLLALPPRPRRRIEVIGDSISCGYGNEAKDQTEHFSSKTENAYLTYGALAARALGAEYVCVAWSGRLMWPKNTMGEVYDRTLPADANSHWDFKRWTPDAVVINLSTNDFAGGVPDKAGWTAGYEAFLARVRKNYPKAAIYCASSPMLWGANVGIAKSYLSQIVGDENAAGNRNVHLLVFETQDGKNGLGADWHPSVKTHRIMADTLTAALTADLGWKTQTTDP